MKHPFSDDEKEFIFDNGLSTDLAYIVNKKTGWPVVVLTMDKGQSWAYAANELPDGRIFDVYKGSYGGKHIFDNELVYLKFDDGEVDDSLVWLGRVPDMEYYEGFLNPTSAAFESDVEKYIEWVKHN